MRVNRRGHQGDRARPWEWDVGTPCAWSHEMEVGGLSVEGMQLLKECLCELPRVMARTLSFSVLHQVASPRGLSPCCLHNQVVPFRSFASGCRFCTHWLRPPLALPESLQRVPRVPLLMTLVQLLSVSGP